MLLPTVATIPPAGADTARAVAAPSSLSVLDAALRVNYNVASNAV